MQVFGVGLMWDVIALISLIFFEEVGRKGEVGGVGGVCEWFQVRLRRYIQSTLDLWYHFQSWYKLPQGRNSGSQSAAIRPALARSGCEEVGRRELIMAIVGSARVGGRPSLRFC